jgi:benzil reductase ((S)-benzoin forming)
MKTGPLTIVTGATRGLGQAMVEQLCAAGGHVVSISRRPVDGLADKAQKAGTELTEILVDLVDAAALQEAAQQLVKTISTSPSRAQCRLIHNAGVVAPIEPASDLTDLSLIRTAFDVNIAAPIYLTAHFLSATKDCQDRRIMMVSSGAGRNAFGSWGVYCATKAAMDRFTEVIEAEGHANTRVSSVAPGIIDTGMQAQIRQTPSEKFPNVDKFAEMHRQGMLTDASQTAKMMLDLLQSDSFGQKLLDDVRDYAQ